MHPFIHLVRAIISSQHLGFLTGCCSNINQPLLVWKWVKQYQIQENLWDKRLATFPERLKNLNDSHTGGYGGETKWSGVSCSRKNCENKAWTQAYILIQVQHVDNQCLHSCKTLDSLYSLSIYETRKRLIKDIFDVECFMEWYSSRIMYRTSGVSKTSSILITHGWNKNKINHLILQSVRGRNGAYITN